MKLNRTTIGLLFVVVVLVFSILTLLYWEFVRDTIIVPVYYLLWVGSLVLKSIPQGLYLAILIFISIIMGWNTLEAVRVRQSAGGTERKQPQIVSRYLHWKRLCANLNSGVFARDTFTWEARRLILAILVYQTGLEIAEVETRIRNGTLTVPDSIRDLIERRIIRGSRPAPRRIERAILRLRRLFLNVESPTDPQMDDRIAEIVTFIETQLEFNHAGRQSYP